ncbi:MAG: alpha-amylase family glycosyl hydrolase [Bacilli bacterium]|nr:alpha-amylase family glycosyl hydrolase [Bacilli bacterium]MDD4809449.1 alpha-amylase family glycosyl hydrolase [Bacilli bacterium]
MRILHLLNWKLNDIINELEQINNQGFNAVQINPIQPLKEDNYSNWWLSYQPCGFRIGNQYGSKEDLIRLCECANNYNIRIIADVICNHMAGSNDNQIKPHDQVDEILKNNPQFWKEPKNIDDWDNRYQVINYCIGNLPGLQLQNHDLQNIIINFLNELIDCGVSGFRFDAAKSIALPQENCDFWTRVIYHLKKYDIFLYGEVIFADQELLYNYSRYINITTNSDYNDKSLKVAYIENHDSYFEFKYTMHKSPDDINNEYRYLTEEYVHTLYYARPYSDAWKNDIVKKANQPRGKVLIKH